MDTETGTAVPRSPVSVKVSLRGHEIVQDKPHPSGGKDEGPMASELLLAAILACQHSTFVKVAAKRRLDAAIVRLHGEMDFQDGDISAIRVRYEVRSSADAAAIETAVRLTDKTCTISRALKVPVHATVSMA